MSASTDKEPTGEDENVRGVLAGWLDDFSAGKCELADMQESFLSVCRRNPDAPWDALALLDQYQRRGRIDMALARSLKTDIAQMVFGVANQTGEPIGADDSEEGPMDTTGSRWRRLVAEPDSESIDDDSEDDEDEPRREQVSRSPERRPQMSRPITSRPAARPDANRPDASHPEIMSPAKAVAVTFEPTRFRRITEPPVWPASASIAQPALARDSISSTTVLRERYELISVVGRGSTGTVYKALDRHRARLPQESRRVAVKVLKQTFSDRPEALADLEREFHQAQTLSHPNIVSVFDLDRDGGTYFIVMELLEGVLLADLIRRREGQPFSQARAMALISSIGAALVHAHRRDVVHADLKPRNVMITSAGEVKVLDFGFARHQPLEPRMVEALQDDLVMAAAAPGYASAERVNGEPSSLSDDVYSLACIAYELLSGQHPFGGRSAVLARAQGRPPKRISSLSYRQWHALQRALRWSRAERKIDVVELLAGLGCTEVPQQLMTPEELLAPAVTGGTTLRRLAIATLLFAVTIAGFLVFQSVAQRESSPADVAADAPPVGATTSPLNAPAGEGDASVQQPTVEPDTAAAGSTPVVPDAGATPIGAQSVVTFDKDTYVVSEGDGAVRLTVKRTGSVRNETTFRWSLKGNSAEAGADFAAIGPSREYMAAGVSSLTLTIPLVSDAEVENTELFLVELESVEGGAALGELPRAAVIIVDDD